MRLGDLMNDEVDEVEVIVKKIRYKNIIWIPEVKKEDVNVNNVNKVSNINNVNKIDKVDKNFTTPVKPGSIKKPYIVKWIAKKDVGDIFTKDDFYKVFPKHKSDVACKRRIDEVLQDMILDQCITVHDNVPGKYRVLK